MMNNPENKTMTPSAHPLSIAYIHLQSGDLDGAEKELNSSSNTLNFTTKDVYTKH